jgi:hypothetical protein
LNDLYSKLAKACLSEEIASLYDHALFVYQGKQLSGTKYSSFLRGMFLKYLEMPIGVADYRQIATAFMSQHLQRPGKEYSLLSASINLGVQIC